MTEPERSPNRPLAAFLLGEVPFDALIALQRRLSFDVGEGSPAAAVILCDHPPGLTVGREGSRRHIRLTPQELVARRWPVRWVARGGGVMLHLPGQVAVYPLLALDRHELTPAEYVRKLTTALVEAVRPFAADAEPDTDTPGVIVRGRRLASVGAAVRFGVTTFGAVVNVAPDLEPFRDIHCDGHPRPMTSVARECSHPVRVPAVRQTLLDAVASTFGFSRVSVFHTLPAAAPAVTTHAFAHRR